MTAEAPTTVSEVRSPHLEGRHADSLVVFGITGDLAKVMTFRSLYRLEKRGLLDCPILGVAVDDWSVDQLIERARESIVGTGEEVDEERLPAPRRTLLVSWPVTSGTTRRMTESRTRSSGAVLPVFYLEIPPFLFGRVVKGLADAGPHDERAASSSRSRSATTSSRPARSRKSCTSRSTRIAALPDRPLPREDGHRRDRLPAVRERAWSSRSGTATTSPPSRSRWRRTSGLRTAAISTTLLGHCATSSSTI